MSRPWKPNPKQLLAFEPAQKLAAALGAKLPGEVPLAQLLDLNTAARKAGARWLVFVSPTGTSEAVGVGYVSQLRKLRGFMKRRQAVVRVESDGVHVRWSSGGLHLVDRYARGPEVHERALQVHVPARAGKEAA